MSYGLWRGRPQVDAVETHAHALSGSWDFVGSGTRGCLANRFLAVLPLQAAIAQFTDAAVMVEYNHDEKRLARIEQMWACHCAQTVIDP